jgi:hypothetical protein
MKKLLGLALVLVAVAGCCCGGESPEPEKVQAIKFVPQEEAPQTAKKATK